MKKNILIALFALFFSITAANAHQTPVTGPIKGNHAPKSIAPVAIGHQVKPKQHYFIGSSVYYAPQYSIAIPAPYAGYGGYYPVGVQYGTYPYYTIPYQRGFSFSISI